MDEENNKKYDYIKEYNSLKERIKKVHEEYTKFNIRYCSDSIIVIINSIKNYEERIKELSIIIETYLFIDKETNYCGKHRNEPLSNALAELKRIIQIMEAYLKDINKTIYDIPEEDENKLREFLSRKDLSIKEGIVFLARLGIYEELYKKGKNEEEIKETIDVLKSNENEKTEGRIITDLFRDFEFIRKMKERTDEDIIRDLNILGDEIKKKKEEVFHSLNHSGYGLRTEKWDDDRCAEINVILKEATKEFNEQQLILNGIYLKKNLEALSNADKTLLGEMAEEELVDSLRRLNKTTDKYKDMEIKELLIELYYTTELIKGYIDRASKKIEDLKKNPSRSENVQQPNSEGFEPND